MRLSRRHLELPSAEDALPGRAQAMSVPERHFVNGNRIVPPFPEGMELALYGMGCFWGAEKKFWQAEGVYSTAVGYAGGTTRNPTYEEVCSGLTGHAEVVRVVFDPRRTSYTAMLKIFWENHDPTQGMRQGNDLGTQYRSSIYCTSSPSASSPKHRRLATSRHSRARAMGASPPRSARPPISTTRRSTTSSTSPRIRGATAASAAREWAARSASSAPSRAPADKRRNRIEGVPRSPALLELHLANVRGDSQRGCGPLLDVVDVTPGASSRSTKPSASISIQARSVTTELDTAEARWPGRQPLDELRAAVLLAVIAESDDAAAAGGEVHGAADAAAAAFGVLQFARSPFAPPGTRRVPPWTRGRCAPWRTRPSSRSRRSRHAASPVVRWHCRGRCPRRLRPETRRSRGCRSPRAA